MKIGIDCRFWSESGIGRYTRNIVSNLAKIDNQNEYVLFVLKKDHDNINLPSNFKKVITEARWHTFKEQIVMPYYFYKARLDLLFVPNLNIPVFYFKKLFVTLHDLTVITIKTGRASTHPYPIYLAKRFIAKMLILFTVFRAQKIFVVSNFVKNDIIKRFHISDRKILTTPNAVSTTFRPIQENKKDYLKEKYNIEFPYIFYVGNAHPHKNLDNLLGAFGLIYKNDPNIHLVIGGRKDFFFQRLHDEHKNELYYKNVYITGFIDDADLVHFYSNALAFVNPSLYEGFGIQLLESFACETPVICSNVSSLPEIGGDAPYYFDPTSKEDMANKIIECINSNNSSRIEKGLSRVKNYSWEKSAKIILDAINNI